MKKHLFSVLAFLSISSIFAVPSINPGDLPVGFASVAPKNETGITVSTKQELVSALAKGGLIYLNGTIDVSEGCLPNEAGGSTPALDSFVKENTNGAYKIYSEFQAAYAAGCKSSTKDNSSSSPESKLGSTLWKLNKAYGVKIKLNLKSDTTLIGLNDAVIKGGTIQLSSVSNVIIRNITIQDGYDPFPHHEKNDGFNAQWDNIAIIGSKNVWIDHCTLEDTMLYKNVTISGGGKEKWQTYDGLCDITKGSSNVVVSYCFFKNHDKTMLIGNSTSDTGSSITVHHNRFLNCGQRLPMAALANMHIFNNSYERDKNAYYKQNASIALRGANYTVIAENNYFGEGVGYCITSSDGSKGKCYISGNVFKSRSEGSKSVSTQSAKPFTPDYDYRLDEAKDIPAILESEAGSGATVIFDGKDM